MNHISEDRLLEYVLETIDDNAEVQEIKRHLGECDDCRLRLDAIAGDIEQMRSIRPGEFEVKAPVVSVPRRARWGLLKAAALIIFGFAAGLGVSFLTDIKPTCISPSYISPSPPADSLIGYAAADATSFDNIPVTTPDEIPGQ